MKSHREFTEQEFPEVTPDEIAERTREIETEKFEKKREREARAAARAAAKKRQRMEKLVAPAILLLTILLGLFVQFLYR